jgi:hypothetical protein
MAKDLVLRMSSNLIDIVLAGPQAMKVYEVVNACRALQKGDKSRRRKLERMMKDDVQTQKIVVAFIAGDHKGRAGMPAGKITMRGLKKTMELRVLNTFIVNKRQVKSKAIYDASVKAARKLKQSYPGYERTSIDKLSKKLVNAWGRSDNMYRNPPPDHRVD